MEHTAALAGRAKSADIAGPFAIRADGFIAGSRHDGAPASAQAAAGSHLAATATGVAGCAVEAAQVVQRGIGQLLLRRGTGGRPGLVREGWRPFRCQTHVYHHDKQSDEECDQGKDVDSLDLPRGCGRSSRATRAVDGSGGASAIMGRRGIATAISRLSLGTMNACSHTGQIAGWPH